MNENELSKKIIGAALEVYRVLGPGLLESAYEASLLQELTSFCLILSVFPFFLGGLASTSIACCNENLF
jgi:hypothetical protein